MHRQLLNKEKKRRKREEKKEEKSAEKSAVFQEERYLK